MLLMYHDRTADPRKKSKWSLLFSIFFKSLMFSSFCVFCPLHHPCSPRSPLCRVFLWVLQARHGDSTWWRPHPGNWHRANSHRPVDLPDTTGLKWREGILWCLESVLPQARTSPPLSVASSSPPSAGNSTLPSASLPSPLSTGKATPPGGADSRRVPRARSSASPSKALSCARSSRAPSITLSSTASSRARSSWAPSSFSSSRAPPSARSSPYFWGGAEGWGHSIGGSPAMAAQDPGSTMVSRMPRSTIAVPESPDLPWHSELNGLPSPLTCHDCPSSRLHRGSRNKRRPGGLPFPNSAPWGFQSAHPLTE